ncbi:MAG: carboxypeptidase regulatory-like domain-containing protein [Bryobacteraceae bacterium]
MGTLLAVGTLFAQETATILGTVTDATGAVVPNAKVTITDTGTNTVRAVTTNQNGIYNAPDLNIGTYTVKAAAPGFKAYTKTGVVVNVSATVRVDIALQVGQSQQSVTVEANAIQVQTETSEQSTVITGQQISQIDTNGRNPVQLAALVPGAASTINGFNPPTALSSNNGISFNGQRSEHNIWRIDGSEAYDRGGGGGMIVNPSPDALAEFRVMTSNYSAKYGAASGGTVNMAIKSGTRSFHGAAWEYNRNDDYDATDFFANRNGTAKPELRYNAFGFNIGGPLFIPHLYNKSRQKTFFFYNMEWRRLIEGSQLTATGIPAQAFTGNFSGIDTIHVPNTLSPAETTRFGSASLVAGQEFPNDTIPANLIDPNAAAFLATGAFPKPNTPDGRYSKALAVPTDLREEIVRIDHHFSDKLAIMGHLIWDSSSQSYATTLWGGDTYPTVGTLMTAPSYSAVVNATYIISPNAVDEVTYNFNGNKLHLVPNGIYKRPSGFNVPEYFTPNNDNRLPRVDIGAPYGVNYDPGSWPWNNVYHANQFGDNLSITMGRHNLQFGASYLRGYKTQDIFGASNGHFVFDGSFTGNAFADFLLGYAHNYDELDIQDAVDTRFNDFAAYAIDNWHVTNRLTVNLGLRWEGLPHAYDVNGRLSNFEQGLYNPANAPIFNADGSLDPTGPGFRTVPGIALSSVPFYLNGVTLGGKNGTPLGLVKNSWDTFAPRVGFAYDLTGKQKTVLRAGFGMFYERIQGNDIYNMGPNPPFSYDPNASNVFFSQPSQLVSTGAIAGTPTFPSGFTALSYDNYKIPTAMQYSFGIEQQLSRAAVLNVSYVGSHDDHEPFERNVNTLPVDSPQRLAVCGGNCGYSGPNANEAPNPYRIYPGFSNITMVEAGSISNYNSLQVSLRWQSSYGLTLNGAYTYSHSLDDISGDLSETADPFDRKYDYASSDFDRRHILVFNYVYDLPFFAHSKGVTHSLLGGWELSGVTTIETGIPLNLGYGKDNLGLGGGTSSRPDITGAITYPKTVDSWFGTGSFAAPAPLQFGTLARNALVGPGRANWDIALFKKFAFGEKASIEFRAETYNSFNHTQFNGVETTLTNGNFGKVTSTFDPRIIQFGAKLAF